MGLVKGGHACIKYLLFFFNLLFWLFGIALVAIGIYVLVADFKDHFEGKDGATEIMDQLRAGAIIFIIVGAIILIVAFLGCCGAIRESQCMLFSVSCNPKRWLNPYAELVMRGSSLVTFYLAVLILITTSIFLVKFFISLFVIFIVLLAAGIFVMVYGIEDSIEKAIKKNLDIIRSEKDNSIKSGLWLTVLEKELDCCGDDGPGDYKVNGYVTETCVKVVRSKKGTTVTLKGTPEFDDGIGSLATWTWNVDEGKDIPGCTKELYDFLSENKLWVGLISTIFGVLLILGIILSLVLCCAIRRTAEV